MGYQVSQTENKMELVVKLDPFITPYLENLSTCFGFTAALCGTLASWKEAMQEK